MIKKIIGKIYSRKVVRWPAPEYDDNNQPHFFFLVTPPYTGSTLIAKLLNTSNKTMFLQKNAEGQWLVPGLSEEDRWNPMKKINYESVKAVWLNQYQKEKKLNPKIEVVIEKSPPNMMRIEKLSSLFRDSSFLVNNRDPYANCASIFYRTHDPEKISVSNRKAAFKMFAQDWVERSNKLKILVNKNNLPKITYEQFCETPSSIFEVLSLPPCVLDSINLSAKVKVKDYEIQSVSNQNERQISYLTNTDMESINSVLKTEVSLLNFFNYKVM